MAGGDTFLIIYLKLQLLAVDKGGTLTYDGLEDSFAEEIALDIDESPDNVKVTLAFLLKYGLCESSDNVNFFLPYCAENTGSETGAAQRKREYRQQKKSQSVGEIGGTSGGHFPLIRGQIPPEIEIEKELDNNNHLNKDVNKIIEQVNNTGEQITNVFADYQHNIAPLTPIVGEKLKDLIEEVGEFKVKDAIRITALQGVHSMAYVEKVARNPKSNTQRPTEPTADPDCPVCHGTGEEVLEFTDGTGEPIRMKCRRCFDPERKKART